LEFRFRFLTHQFHDSLTDAEALEVIDNGKDFDEATSRDGNDRTMYVGWIQGRTGLWEVGVEWVSASEAIVFHGMKATTEYERKFEED
jgi:hypothetical protein